MALGDRHHWSAFDDHACVKCGELQRAPHLCPTRCPGVLNDPFEFCAKPKPTECDVCGCTMRGGHFANCPIGGAWVHNQVSNDPLADLTAHVEFGLTRWPDGETAVCVFNHEPYETYALGYRVGVDNTTDANLIADMRRYIDDLKIERKAKFISWRKRPEITERYEVETAQDMLLTSLLEHGTRPKLINETIRTLRCRVLITAHANDKEWRDSDEGRSAYGAGRAT
jgi:hypothetical protein